jgi:hypothetical protein
LRIFKNVPLKDIIIVDNAVYSFGAQLDNGIPITPFKEDPDDNEFVHLMGYLEKCVRAEDFREINRRVFRFGELLKYEFDKFIDLYDYEKCEKIFQEDDDLDEHLLGRSVTWALDGL